MHRADIYERQPCLKPGTSASLYIMRCSIMWEMLRRISGSKCCTIRCPRTVITRGLGKSVQHISLPSYHYKWTYIQEPWGWGTSGQYILPTITSEHIYKNMNEYLAISSGGNCRMLFLWNYLCPVAEFSPVSWECSRWNRPAEEWNVRHLFACMRHKEALYEMAIILSNFLSKSLLTLSRP